MDTYTQLPHSPWHDNVSIVLVEPGDGRNLGSVARAMDNLGFSDLRLVAPREIDWELAEIVSCHGSNVLKEAKSFDDLAAALEPFHDVVGFTAATGRDRRTMQSVIAWVDEISTDLPRKTALVFGPEETGLRREHLGLCRQLVSIPSRSGNRAYNLSHAVLIALYEVSRLGWREESIPEEAAAEPADWNDFDQLDRMLQSVGKQSGFFRDGTSERVPGLLSNIVRRLSVDKREIAILLGLFGRVERQFRRGL